MTQVPRRQVTRNGRRRPARRSILRPVLGFLVLTLAVVLLVGIGAFIYFYTTSPTFHDTAKVLITRADSPAKAFPGRDEINLLIMGRDFDRDRRGRILKTHGRTDAIMLAHIDFRNRSVNILSIPRDTLVRVPGYRGKMRINAANALGGPDLAVETVEKFLGVSPDYYSLVNFQGFEKAIDRLGGLPINVDKQLDYDDNWGGLHIHLKPGKQTLNGDQAMGFVRYRHSNNGGGDSDFVRISRQQQMLQAMKSKFSNPLLLFKVPGILDTIRGDMDSTLSTSQMVCLARFMKSLPAEDGIEMATIPATEGSLIYVIADRNATRELVNKMFHPEE